MMTSVDELRTLFIDKVIKTGSLDAGFLKAIWVAYQRGREDALREITEAPKVEKWKSEGN